MNWIKLNRNNFLLHLLVVIFFLFFAFHDGVKLAGDSDAYIAMLDYIEPLYPLLIAFFRLLIGEGNNYLFGVVLFQSLLMAYATITLCDYISKEYKYNSLMKCVPYLIVITVSLLSRFAAKRSVMYSNIILTEGVAYPLFLIFIKNALCLINEKDLKHFIICCVLTFIGISIRKQMYICLVLLLLVVCYISVQSKKIIKGVICVLLSSFVILGGCKLFDASYMKITKGIETSHTGDNRFISTMIFYVSDISDGNYIEDEEVRQIFVDVYRKCEDGGYLRQSNTDKGWYSRVKHFQKNYDSIQVETMWPMLREYAKVKLNTPENLVEKKVDEINTAFINSLLLRTLPRMFSTIFDNFLAGMMITISADKSVFAYYSIFAYLFYCCLLVYLLFKKDYKTFIFSMFILISILANVSLVSATVFCQTRYTIYNMALFYISLFTMIAEWKGEKHE